MHQKDDHGMYVTSDNPDVTIMPITQTEDGYWTYTTESCKAWNSDQSAEDQSAEQTKQPLGLLVCYVEVGSLPPDKAKKLIQTYKDEFDALNLPIKGMFMPSRTGHYVNYFRF